VGKYFGEWESEIEKMRFNNKGWNRNKKAENRIGKPLRTLNFT